MEEITTIDPADDFSRKGIAAVAAFTVCMGSVSKALAKASGVAPLASAEALHTRISIPPRCFAECATQRFSASRSTTSSASPYEPGKDFCWAATAFPSRAQKDTEHPSAARL